MNKAFFFETEGISDPSILLDEFESQGIFFSYFEVDQKYYLFFYSEKWIEIDFLYQSIDVIQELNSKKREIRSLRGFFLYALEIMEDGKDVEVLKTNLKPFFWRKVKNIIRQNKKSALQEFLFGSKKTDLDIRKEFQHLKEKVEALQNQVDSLHKKITQLENQVQNSKTLSEGSRSLQNGSSAGERYNLSSNKNEAQNPPNFITLARIPEQEKVQIIQTGFQRQADRKISLKQYYESTQPYSLFQLKGYNIKYETIRHNKIYKKLKQQE